MHVGRFQGQDPLSQPNLVFSNSDAPLSASTRMKEPQGGVTGCIYFRHPCHHVKPVNYYYYYHYHLHHHHRHPRHHHRQHHHYHMTARPEPSGF